MRDLLIVGITIAAALMALRHLPIHDFFTERV